jgi:diadenosine tetraphosphate (Ap4A) HIT family hydrolase
VSLLPKSRPLLASNPHAFAIRDRRPVSSGHSLIVSRSHVTTIFDPPLVEYGACFELVREVKELLSKEKNTESFNIVVNCGPDASQTVSHAHIHLVPRYQGEMPYAADAWSSIR